MVKNVLPSGFAIRTRKIRKAMSLLEINGKDVATEKLANIVELLRSSGRPLTLMWASAPSRPSLHLRIVCEVNARRLLKRLKVYLVN